MPVDRRAALAGIGVLLVAAMGAVASPRHRLAADLAPLNFENNIPYQIGDWRVDQSIAPVLPSADVQERLDKLYNSLFSRTYIHPSGKRVMFLIAYGADQADRMSLAHLPEACYSTQGFEVWPTEISFVPIAGGTVGVRRLRTRKATRVEPVTYWTTVGNGVYVDEFDRRMARARYALHGIIPDGMLVRVSSIDENEHSGFEYQADFVAALYSGLPKATRERLFGWAS
jgi:EpsI family protein